MSRSPRALEAGHSPTSYIAGWQATLDLLRRGKSWSGYERNCAFLNLGRLDSADARFADVSAATGLDFPDDGRGLAVVDWDGDGDLDLWLSSRTAPRLRLLLNQSKTSYPSVSLRLRGTTSNRDAIGARAEVELEPDPSNTGAASTARLVRTIYAGDGFLSQSSKWLHFGLGANAVIQRVTVRWPDGQREVFEGARAGGRYVLTEGTGSAQAVAARPRVKAPLGSLAMSPQSGQDRHDPGVSERALLPYSVPLPPLFYQSLEGSTQEAVKTRDRRPLLLNLWASWCVPCVSELKELSAREGDLRAAELDVLALSVDGLDRDRITSAADAKHLLETLRFPFEAGFARPELLEKLELLQETLFDRTLPLAVPVSFLLDREGNLAATYRGRVNLDQLVRDVASLDQSWEGVQTVSAPLSGSWVAALPGPDPAWLAKKFGSRFPAAAEGYLRSALKQLADRNSASLTAEQTLRRDTEEADLRLSLADAIFKQGRRSEAIDLLRQAIELAGDLGRAHRSLASVLRSEDPAAAIRHYRRAVEILPSDAEAHHGLGLALRTVGRLDEAFHHLAIARQLRPEWTAPLIPMAWILIGHPDPNPQRAIEAVRLAEQAVASSEDRHPVALDTLAAAYFYAERPDDAIATAREAIDRARALGNDSLTAEIESRLQKYLDDQERPDSG